MSESNGCFVPQQLISGGQTGVDRGALEAAIALGIEHGGWCPKGRVSEDGEIPSRYLMWESDSPDYAARTERNVIASDATLILYEHKLSGGTLLTQKFARRHGKPLMCCDIAVTPRLLEVQQWLLRFQPRVLNVAGPRESNAPGIEDRARDILLAALS